MRPCAIRLEMWIEARQGRADETTLAQIRAHDAQNCPECRQNLAWIGRFAQAMQELERVAVPDDATARATALFRETFVRAERPRWLARLVFDSRTQAQPSFARGGRDSAWQRLYSADNYNVELWQEGNAREGWYLIGQILPPRDGAAIPPAGATLIAPDGAARQAELNEDEFHAEALLAGTYQIHIQAPDGDILLSDVTIGA